MLRMLGLENGRYKTAKGTEVLIAGIHGEAFAIHWNIAKEGACPDCEPYLDSNNEGHLMWKCDWCEGGSSRLVLMEKEK